MTHRDGASHSLAERPIVEVADLKLHFKTGHGLRRRGTGTVRAVDGVSLHIERGESLGLVGESGCGKSTLGRAILRLYEPTHGSVRYDGIDLTALEKKELRSLRHRFQLIAQDPYSSLNPAHSVRHILTTAISRSAQPHTKAEARDRVVELLETVGLDGRFADRYPHEFSGGQRQRVAIARSLATHPEFIVCDEPVSALDVSIQAQIVNLLAELQQEFSLTYLFVSHDLAVVRYISDRVAVMYAGRLVEVGPPSRVFEEPAHPYTRALLSAVPIPDPLIEKKRTRLLLTGDVPSPDAGVEGCRFRSRCWLYQQLGRPEQCALVEPELEPTPDTGDGYHLAACHYIDETVTCE